MQEGILTKQILKKLVCFSAPLILSGILQQLFNWVDALIVGNYLGENALGGVGATTSIYNLSVNIIVGFTLGLTVKFAGNFGEGKQEESRKLLAKYSVILGAVFLAVCIAAIICVPLILDIMETPIELYDYARDYLRFVLMGIPFLAVYNTFAAALRGRGNSKTPFVAVIICSTTNALLDYLFTAICGFGVTGTAVATAISQCVMAVYLVLYTFAKYPELRFSFSNLKEYKGVVRKSIKFCIPPAAQSSVTSVGNVFLQRFMNGFGETTVSAITTAYRVDTVLFLPMVNFSTAIATLVAQERGAKNTEAAKKIFKLGTILIMGMAILLAIIMVVFGKYLLSMFGLTAEAIQIGVEFFNSIAIFYLVYGLCMSIKGFLEGCSDMLFSGITGICALFVRIGCSYAFKELMDKSVIAYAEVFAWVFMLIVLFVRYLQKRNA